MEFDNITEVLDPFDYFPGAEDDWFQTFLDLEPQTPTGFPEREESIGDQQNQEGSGPVGLQNCHLPSTSPRVAVQEASASFNGEGRHRASGSRPIQSNYITPQEWSKLFYVVSSVYSTHTLSQIMDLLSTNYGFKAR